MLGETLSLINTLGLKFSKSSMRKLTLSPVLVQAQGLINGSSSPIYKLMKLFWVEYHKVQCSILCSSYYLSFIQIPPELNKQKFHRFERWNDVMNLKPYLLSMTSSFTWWSWFSFWTLIEKNHDNLKNIKLEEIFIFHISFSYNLRDSRPPGILLRQHLQEVPEGQGHQPRPFPLVLLLRRGHQVHPGAQAQDSLNQQRRSSTPWNIKKRA